MSDKRGELQAWDGDAKATVDDFFRRLDETSGLVRADPALQRHLDAWLAGRSVQEAFEPRF